MLLTCRRTLAAANPPPRPGDAVSYPLPTDTPPPPGPARPRPWLWIGAVALALVAGAGGTALALSGGSEPSRAEQAAALPEEPAATPTVPVATSPSPATTPPMSAIKLSPKITKQKCFGSAGCNVEFDIDMKWVGFDYPQAGTVWRLTYEVTGIEDAPAIGSLRFNGEGGYSEVSERVQTTGPKAKIRIAVTRIELESA